jgi:hypothetical protein
VCTEPGGFHGYEPHAAARAAVPPELTWKPSETPPYRVTENERRDRLIAEWHDLPADDPRTLWEYMGLSWSEYRAWAEGHARQKAQRAAE